MDHSLQRIGASLSKNPELGKLSRRGFMLATATLASCKAASTAPDAAVKTSPNTSYRTPSLGGPVPRNNVGNLSSNFSKYRSIIYPNI